MKVKCIKVTPKNTYGKYDDITIGKVYEAFKDGDFLIVEDDKGDLWDYEAELFEEVKEPLFKIGDKVCLSSGDSWLSDEEYRIVLGFENGLYKLAEMYLWMEEDLKLYETITINDEEYIMEFIRNNKLDYFTGNVIKCMIRFNQTQDKQYLADSIKFIEAMV